MKTVLVVDDSRIMRNIVKNTLIMLKIPCRFLEAENGKKAFQVLKINQVNLVLLDWNMPEMNGIYHGSLKVDSSVTGLPLSSPFPSRGKGTRTPGGAESSTPGTRPNCPNGPSCPNGQHK